jgi:hypothetical protein
MPSTPIPELEPKRKPEPEFKHPRKPEPEIKPPTTPAKPEVGEQSQHSAPLDREDAHIGATEDQVSDTTAPSGDAFKDEPRQG